MSVGIFALQRRPTRSTSLGAVLLGFQLGVLLATPASPASAQAVPTTSLAEDRAAAAQPFDSQLFERQFTTRSAVVDGVRISYVIGGSGPPVLLVHGWPETWYTWRRLMPGLALAGYTVIAPDLPGIGNSSVPPDFSKLTAARLLNGLMRQLGHASSVVVAHDVGGMIGYAYAATYPNDVARLALIDTSIPGFGLEGKMDPATGGSFHFGFNAQVELAQALVTGREAYFIGEMVTAATEHQTSIEEGLREYQRAYADPTTLRSGFEYYAAMLADGRANRAAFRSKLPMPVMAIVATDRALPGQLREIAADVRSVVVEHSGHFVQEERPVLLTRLLVPFFEDTEAARSRSNRGR